MSCDDVSQDQMRIFFLLDILTWRQHVGIDHLLDLTSFCSEQTDGRSTRLFCNVQRVDDVERVPTRANADHDISWLYHICQLLCKDVFIGSVVAPGGDQGHMVRQRNSFHSRRSGHDGVLCQVECEMRGGGSTTTIPHDKYAMSIAISIFEKGQYILQMRLRDISQHLFEFGEVGVDRCL